jgi:protein-S-isoprenylcysteine O-methyltransferase Ste14
MNPFSVLFMVALLVFWIAFEIWLVVRDRFIGKGTTGKDSGTRYFNFIALTVGFSVASIIRNNPIFFFPGGRSFSGYWIGIGIMLLGFGLRLWAIISLGSSFRTTIETHVNQQVVTTGPYMLVRHPSYSGLIIFCIGYGIALQNWLSLAIAVIIPLISLLYRIRIEEKVLLLSFGIEYENYISTTKKLIPWIW